MKWLCIFLSHKSKHVTDIVSGTNKFEQLIRVGLFQCKRCKELSLGKLSQIPTNNNI